MEGRSPQPAAAEPQQAAPPLPIAAPILYQQYESGEQAENPAAPSDRSDPFLIDLRLLLAEVRSYPWQPKIARRDPDPGAAVSLRRWHKSVAQ